ncbi:2',3'-cyclic-nucleotide 2'-phosphodiesterase/3'-nucleotidase [Bosea thiooxidans]
MLETTDLHVNVVPYDYFRDGPDDTVGLAKTASLIKAAQSEAKNSLLFDNGDFLQGSSLGDYIAYKKGLKAGETHPMLAAMNALPYLCGTLGNHEFNYGLEFLEHGLATAEFPLVCANVERISGYPLVDPWRLFEQSFEDEAGAKHLLKIGVIGFVPPQIMQWDKANLDGKLSATDIVDAAGKHLPDLLDAQPDLVIALCHSGIAGGARRGMEENAALHLSKLEGIDVILTGHQHLVFPGGKAFDDIPGVDNVKGALNGKPACQPGFWGSHPASSTSNWKSAAGAGWSPISRSSQSRSTSARPTARSCRRPPPSQRSWPASRPTTRRRSPICASRWAAPPRRSTPTSRW